MPKTAFDRIVVLKADHIGDLLIAAPAFHLLRQFFPTAQIDLVCGPWNVGLAHKLGVFDNVYGVSVFHEIGAKQSEIEIALAARRQGVRALQELHLGPYDLAIDLRHDRDSRTVLPAIDACVYAGFGTSREFPFLDIALPLDDGSTGNRGALDLLLSGRNFDHGGQITSAKDIIELELFVTGAISPAECGTVARDNRKLGIGLNGITVSPVCEEKTPVPSWEPLSVKPPHRDVALVSGWCEPEDWGVWGVGNLLRLRLQLPPVRGESAVQLDFDLIAHVHRANPEVICQIRIEGDEVGEPAGFLYPKNQQTVPVTVPRHHKRITLKSEPFSLSPGLYEGTLRVYLPLPVTPDMTLTLTLRGVESGAVLSERRIGSGILRRGICDASYSCVIETGEQMLSFEISTNDAGAFEGSQIEMLTLRCISAAKLNVPPTHMENRAKLLVLRIAMQFSREPPFGDDLVANNLGRPDGLELGGLADKLRERLLQWKAAGACLVGIGLGCSNPIRTWPRHYFIELCRSLVPLGKVQLVFIGGPADREDADEACRQLSLDADLHSLCGTVGLEELGPILQPLDLFIGNNTGTTHYAGRVGVRTVGIYSGTNHPREWGPVGENVSWIYRDEACAPCFLSDLDACRYGHVCLKNLLPTDVYPVVAPEIMATLCRRQLSAPDVGL